MTTTTQEHELVFAVYEVQRPLEVDDQTREMVTYHIGQYDLRETIGYAGLIEIAKYRSNPILHPFRRRYENRLLEARRKEVVDGARDLKSMAYLVLSGEVSVDYYRKYREMIGGYLD